MITADIQVFYIAIEKQGPIIGMDFGTKKLGVAMTNKELTFAMPLFVMEPNIPELKLAIERHKPRGIVLGMPINMDGSHGSQTQIVQKFAEKLSVAFELPIFLQDERLTSRAASNSLKIFGFKRKERDKIDDQVAACMLLESAISGIGLVDNN
ncbi:MAG: Holliday junction resolvase RuvX [Pseudomonadota bacterium]